MQKHGSNVPNTPTLRLTTADATISFAGPILCQNCGRLVGAHQVVHANTKDGVKMICDGCHQDMLNIEFHPHA
jgi:hypothetical protein